jgi:serine/threonine-protein kinase
MADPRIIGPYQILARIASGGMGTVYHAYNPIEKREVALKVLRGDRSDDATFIKRFQREAAIMAELQHPNIARVYEVGHIDGYYFIEMEYLPGGNLSTEIKQIAAAGQAMSVPHALEITRQVAAGLMMAHERGLVHRDIKPSNILISNDGRYVLSDFGIVWYSDMTHFTKTAQVMGTPEYMSPEQCQALEIDARSDLYSLGCVLFEMLTGYPPFTAEAPLAVTLKQVQESPKPVHEVRPDVPRNVSQMLSKLLSKQPRQRYQNAQTLIHVIERIFDPDANPDAPIPIDNWLSTTFMQRPPAKVLLGIAAALALIIGMVGLLMGYAASSSQANPTANSGNVVPTQPTDANATPTMAIVEAPMPSPASVAAPTPAPTPTPAAVLTVSATFVNVRLGPDLRFAQLGQLAQSEVATVTGTSADGEWFQIVFVPGPQGVGWVKHEQNGRKLVEPNGQVANIQSIIIPTLTPWRSPAFVCPRPGVGQIVFPAHGEQVINQLAVYGTADIEDGGYGKIELRQDGGWQFVGEFRSDKPTVSLLAQLAPRAFARLKTGVTQLRMVIVSKSGQETDTCLSAIDVVR